MDYCNEEGGIGRGGGLSVSLSVMKRTQQGSPQTKTVDVGLEGNCESREIPEYSHFSAPLAISV